MPRFVYYRAPEDCVQYFTGAAGNLMSYSFQTGTAQIQGIDFLNCIRQEEGT